MSEFLEFVLDLLQTSAWLRRIVFSLLIGVLVYTGFWSWSALLVIGFIWLMMELPDLIWPDRRRPGR